MHASLGRTTDALPQTAPQLLEGVELKFYLVPLRKNALASFLARHDGWYKYVPEHVAVAALT